MGEHRRREWALAVMACAATLPVLLPGGEAYMDNAPHLVTLRALSTAVLPSDRWFTGWTDLAEAGFAAGQVNAPLAWTAVALLGAFGVPMTPLYLLCIPLSNVVFALGAWRLGVRVLRTPEAAFVGAALAAVSVTEIYGIAGTAGGMWPFRLATGVFFGGLGVATTWRWRGAWIATVFLLHTFAGIAALAWVALDVAFAAWRRDPRGVGRGVAAMTLGLALAAFYWVPLLDPALRAVLPDKPRNLVDYALLLTLPMDARRVVSLGAPMTLLGGAWGLPAAFLFGAGIVGSRGRLVGGDRTLLAQLAVAMTGLIVVLGVVLPLTEWGALGPNPWRYYVFIRVPLFLLAGLGLADRPLMRPLLVLLALCTAGGGWTVVPHRLAPARERAWADLEATWADVVASGPAGRVYHEDTATKGERGDLFYDSHVGALLSARSGLPTLGTWFGLTTVRSHPWTTSEGPYILGQRAGKPDFNMDYFYRMFRLYQVDTVVTATVELAGWLGADSRFGKLSSHGSFAAYRVVAPLLAPIGIAPEVGAISDIDAARGRMMGTVRLLAGGGVVRTRETWHPWWRATLDGDAVPVTMDGASGTAVVTVPRSGRLELRWENRDSTGGWVSLGALLVLTVGMVGRRRDGADGRSTATPASLEDPG